MSKFNVLANALKTISNAEKIGKSEVLLKKISSLVVKFLKIMQKKGYIGKILKIEDHRCGKVIVELIGRINKCRVISPRFDIKLDDFETWINKVLPSRQYGFIILSTSLGMMDHRTASIKKTGGKILGFFY
ncbi:40S ribosomal protein S15A [Guillardia theta]|uniref:40S ribosomal protein S15A n=1 Tax=Guillardia theta TaxID=55529 RepID=Q9AVX4_GUITH|nr:40S ribosomal protein S15A [Guillardia theta]CAC27097.1 40S ribosomal protein S15A [Guillardia theta]|mmetsp:Transcript_50741/g.158534  ORF Transcript_50741/g.158534 Transcript_50741/m.158534 type:complete len:131 (-) Transcript_50741:3433-3825(-)